VLVRVSVRVRVSWSPSLAGCGGKKEVGKRNYFTSKGRPAYLGPGLGFAKSQEGEFGLGRGALVLSAKSVSISIVRLFALDGY
jgi:hypothetical protein